MCIAHRVMTATEAQSMSHNDSKEQMKNAGDKASTRSGETHSGTPNAENPNESRSNEHKSGYGGELGEPRTSSDPEKTKQ